MDVETIRDRNFRLVIDYGYSAASFVLPLVLAPLGVQVISAHEFATDRSEHALALREAVGQAKRLVAAVRADLGAVFDRSAERLHLIDENGAEVPVDQALLLFVRLIAASERTGRLAFPVTVSSHVEELAGDNLEVVRTPASLADLTAVAASDGVVFGGRCRAATSSRTSCPPMTRSRASASCWSCSRPSTSRSPRSSQGCRSRRSSTARSRARGG